MPLLDSPVLYPAPKVQWYTPTPRKPSHENPLGIVFPEDTRTETMVTGARRLREGSPPEDLMMVKIDGALDLLPSDNFGPHFYCATAYYPGEGNAEINARKTEFAVGKANPAHPDLDNCMLQKTVVVPYNRKQQLLMVEIHEVDPEDSEVEDSLIGQATLPLADPKIESSTNWPLFRGFECSGSLAVQVHIPQVNSTSPKTLDCATPSVCKRAKRSNTPPKGFPEPVSPHSRTVPYRCKRSERSDTPPEGFPEPVSPSRVAHPTLLESLRHGQQTPEEKKCKAFDKDARTQDIASPKIFTGCAPCDAFLESMRQGPDLLAHSPLLKSLMSGVDPLADVDIRLPTQTGGNQLQSCIRADQAQTASDISGNVRHTPASYVPARPHQSHTPPHTSYNPVPMQQSLLGTSNPTRTLQYRQGSYMRQVAGYSTVCPTQTSTYHVQHRQVSYMPQVAGRKPIIKQQSLPGAVSLSEPAISSSARHMHASYMPSPSSQKPVMQPSLLGTKRPTDIQMTSAVSSSVQAMFTLPTAMGSCKPYTMQQSRAGTARPTQTMPAFSGNVQYMQMQPAGARSYHPFAGQYYTCV